jgi:gluconokinase
MTLSEPILWVVMGVSGSGKSTLALALADAFGLEYTDGDDFHSKESVAKMQSGIALNDEDRWPWLDRIGEHLRMSSSGGVAAGGRVVACSALKRAYRDHIRRTAPGVHFLFLNGDAAQIRARLGARQNHFMHPELLQSQLATLELPQSDERDVTELDVGQSVDALVATVRASFASPENRVFVV